MPDPKAPASTRKPVKTTLSLPADTVDILRTLASERNTTLAEVVRRALSLDKYLDDARKTGCKILVEDPEKTSTTQLVIF